MSDRTTVTRVGKKVASSGLLPESAFFLLETLVRCWPNVERLLGSSLVVPPGSTAEEAIAASTPPADLSDLAFFLFHLCLCSPEYQRADPRPPRQVPFQLADRRDSVRARRLDPLLCVRPWDSDIFAVNAADIAVDWINGAALRDLEGRFADLRSGSLHGLFRDLGQILAALAELVETTTSPTLPIDEVHTTTTPADAQRASLRRLPYALRRLCARLHCGLPDEVTWLADIGLRRNNGTRRRLVTNQAAMAIYQAGLTSPDAVLDPGRFSELIQAVRPSQPNANEFAKELQSAVRQYRTDGRLRVRDRHATTLPEHCRELVRDIYAAADTGFENCLAAALNCLRIKIEQRDGPGRTAFPDFVLSITSTNDIVVECKSKKGDEGEVTFNDATDVIRKAGVNGYGSSHKVTVCQPYLCPDVARKLTQCPDLSVVNFEDLAEALVRLYRGKIALSDLLEWLTTPGQPRRETLPFRSAS